MEKEIIKKEICRIAALTDRGQRLNKLIAPVYKDQLIKITQLVEELEKYNTKSTKDKLSGEWELIFSNVELFRSSPFFLAIEDALDNEFKSNLFFKLHQLQIGSFGISTIGRISQIIDFEEDKFISTFDTTLFGLTVIPIFGWFKLLPTFGGRVKTLATKVNLEENTIKMILQKTKVVEVEGLNKIPLISSVLMDRW